MRTITLKLSMACLVAITFSLTVVGQKVTKSQDDLHKLKQTTSNAGSGSGQVATKITNVGNDKLEQLRKEYKEKYARLKDEANTYASVNSIPLEINYSDGGFGQLQRITQDGFPIYYRTFNVAAAVSTRANYLNTGGGLGLNLNGDELIAHVWDGGHARISHDEYDGAGGDNRVSLMDTADEGGTQLNFHAAHVTGTIAAEGLYTVGGIPNGAKGMAWQSNVRGYMWNDDLAEAAGQAGDASFNKGFGMLVSNHSYGFAVRDADGNPQLPSWIFGSYYSETRDWDALLYNAPYYMMVVAAGNDGDDNTANANPLNGQAAYDKLTGHSVCKNNLVIANGEDAAINGDGSLNSVNRNSSSSEGPTDDFRIKPDLMGNGTGVISTGEASDTSFYLLDGTSMASPNVTGSLLLLQEHYDNLNNTYMRAASLKGLALHTADDAGTNGPDAQYGWGLMNSKAAAEAISAANSNGDAVISELTLTTGQTYQVTVQANGVDPLVASISWTDPAGTVNNNLNDNTPTLVNDLDLNLDNGATFYPWRLTGVATNSNSGENNVDPFERVDVSGASGNYTLTVNHDGSLSSGSQDYTLIITGGKIVSGTTPEIAFGTTSGSTTEDSGCGFTDVTVPLTIGAAPSTTATVNFTVNVGSSATENADFELLTSSLDFTGGSTASQNMTLRVYHDEFTESDETIVIDFTVNANGGDATANTASDSYTLTILDDDIAPTSTIVTTLIAEDFEDAAGWTIAENDSDTQQWGIFDAYAHGNLSGKWAGSVTDQSVVGGSGVLTPDNFIFSPQVVIPAGISNTEVIFEIGDLGNAEHYAVYFAATNSVAGALAGTLIEEGNSVGNNTSTRSINLGNLLAGQTGYLVFRHYNTTGNSLLMLDTVSLITTENRLVQSTTNLSTQDQVNIDGTGTVYTSDSASGNVMLDITNNDSFDYGCTTVLVSRAGTGGQAYNGSVAPNLVMDKTFNITPTSANSSGDVSIMFYFTESEVLGWETTTGLSRTALRVIRNTGGFSETSLLAIGAFGTNVTFAASFTGVSGTYSFGTADAIKCTNTRTYSGSWDTVPDANSHIVVSSNYNTSAGSIDSCRCTVDASRTLTVEAGDYLNITSDITINGSLIVEHEGSVVQVDKDALVTNNGTINVEITTPILQTRDFMIMGSPMTAEERTGVFTDAFLVLKFNPTNFIPNVGVPAGGTNFADDDGNFYTTYNGTIHPGEGYVVRPQSGYTDPANTSYDMIYELGTLNNGDISHTFYNNGSLTNPNGTPNVLSNPYASAISANTFMSVNGVSELYFWEHLTPPSTSLPGAGTMNFSMDDISYYNGSMGIPAANDPGTSTAPNGVISTGQGFAVRTSGASGTTGTMTFTNDMRLTTGNNTLRGAVDLDTEIEKLTLNVRNAQYGIGSYAGIAFQGAGSIELDEHLDTNRLATVVSLYTHLEDGSQQLGIQTRESFDSSIKISMGFATQVDAGLEYSISKSNFEGSNLSEATVYLIDHYTGTTTNLNETDYVFESHKGVFDGRFTVQFEGAILSTNDTVLEAVAVFPNPTNNELHIVSPRAIIERVTIHDVRGRKIREQSYSNSSRIQLDLSSLDSAMYFVTISTSKGSITKRVVKK